MSKELIIEECIDSVKKIFSNYNDDEIFNRIKQYICHQMPVVIKNYNESLQKKTDLSTEYDYFIEFFLNKNQYFYVPQTGKFFYYDNKTYTYNLYREDDILHKILLSIREKRLLQPWKYKTKNNIMKRIKNNNLLDTIPESQTIQQVIHLFTRAKIFNDKEEVKYFLTIVGDNILKKNSNLIHIVNTESKDFIRELNSICYGFIGFTCDSSFKFKFHDHVFSNTRLLNMKSVEEDIWLEILMKNTVDIICVSCHYSNRYNGSDNFLFETNVDESISDHIFYLKDRTSESIIEEFILKYIESTIDTDKIQSNLVLNKDTEITKISMKDMQYLWRHFLNYQNLPNIVFQNNFKKIIIEKLNINYNSEIDSFIGLSSKYLPIIKLFLEYWNDNINIVDEENENEFEINEIVILFKKWCMDNYNTNINLSEKKALDLISYFYPEITIDQNKFIYQIKTDLWNKNEDIICAYNSFKIELDNKYGKREKNVSIYDIYNYYTNMYRDTKLIAGKQYFERFIKEYFYERVIDDNYIKLD